MTGREPGIRPGDLPEDSRLRSKVKDGRRCGVVAGVQRVQHKVEADAVVIPRRGIGDPLVKIPRACISTGLLAEDDPVDEQLLRGFHHGAGCQGTAASGEVLPHSDFQVFLNEVGARREGQVDAGVGIGVASEELAPRRVSEPEAIVQVGKGQPVIGRRRRGRG